MSHSDELRILAHMHTFTVDDLANAIDYTRQGAALIIESLLRERVIERIRVGKSYVYALTARGEARVAKMQPIDPDERCLPISFEGVSPEPRIAGGCCPGWSSADMRYVAISDMIGAWQCPHCEKLHPVAVYNPH